jgi:hypothetical protein
VCYLVAVRLIAGLFNGGSGGRGSVPQSHRIAVVLPLPSLSERGKRDD